MKTRAANRDQGEGRNTTMTQQAAEWKLTAQHTSSFDEWGPNPHSHGPVTHVHCPTRHYAADGITTNGIILGEAGENAAMLKALKGLMPWMGKALADDAFARCARPSAARAATEEARQAIKDAEKLGC